MRYKASHRARCQWDLIAGCSVGAMMVPSGLSYAAIASLPSVIGKLVSLFRVASSCQSIARLAGPGWRRAPLLGNGGRLHGSLSQGCNCWEQRCVGSVRSPAIRPAPAGSYRL